MTTRRLVYLLALPLLLPIVACVRFWLAGGDVMLNKALVHVHTNGRCRTHRVPLMCQTHSTWVCMRSHCGGPLTACKSNLKNIGTALEMYSTDHGGRYPSTLAELSPRYLKRELHCWEETIGCPANSGYLLQSTASNYTVVCTGLKHTAAGVSSVNYPQYTCAEGLRER